MPWNSLEEKRESKKWVTNAIYSDNLAFLRQNRKRERERPRLRGHSQFTDSFQPQNGVTDKNEMENERINWYSYTKKEENSGEDRYWTDTSEVCGNKSGRGQWGRVLPL